MATVVSLLALFGLGTCFALLGSVSVKLMPRLNIDAAKFGSLVSGFMAAALVSSLVVGITLDQVGFQPVAIAGFVAVTAVILLIARGKTFGATLGAAILLGIAAMALNTAGNTMAPQVLAEYGFDAAAASNIGNVFFGLGLFLTPLITSTLFKKTSYENAVSALAILMAVGAVIAFVANDYPAAQGSITLGDAFAQLANPAVLVSALGLFCYISLEGSFTNFLAPFGKEVLKTNRVEGDVDAKAARLLTLFAIGMMVGRLVTGLVPSRIGVDLTQIGPFLIAAVALGTVLVILAMTRTQSVGLAQGMAFVSGLLFAPIFPTIVGVTFSKTNPALAGSIFGIIFAVGLLGGTIIPKAIGNMAAGSSVQRGLRLLIPVAIILIGLALAQTLTGSFQQ